MFEDIDGNRYSVDKIVKISKSEYRGLSGNGVVRHEHQVWLLGLDQPVWVDFRWIENIENTAGRAIPCVGSYHLVDMTNDIGSPELIAIVGWLVPLSSSSDLVPITINGINNGNPDSFPPILHPDGKVSEWDRWYTSLDECISSYAEERKNG